MGLYSESPQTTVRYRQSQVAQFEALIQGRREELDAQRRRFFQPDLSSIAAYRESTESYRHMLKAMLGWPLTLPSPSVIPAGREESVSDDDLGKISRVWIETLPGYETYGLLFLPQRSGPHRLVISQCGGAGVPEKCSGFYGSSGNYNDMTRRILRRGCAVFAPQLLLWESMFEPAIDRYRYDPWLRQVGGSLAAFEIWCLQRCLDHLCARNTIDGNQVGICGLSYGGFYALYTAAVDTRIKVCLSSCFFNNREVYALPDCTWLNSAGLFLDAEAAALVCPRTLYLEVGKRDATFVVQHAGPEAAKVRHLYDALGISERFRYKEHDGIHEFDKEENGIDFLMNDWGITL